MRSRIHYLVTKLYERRGYQIKHTVTMEGNSGLIQSFNLFATKTGASHVIQIMDWKRTVGVNMVILDKAATDVGIPNAVIVAEKFSDHAKAYAKRRGLTLLTKQELTAQTSSA
jgi:hypothetical protein